MGLQTRDLEVRHCRVLLAVRDAGGVGAAARSLGVAQSTVSETLLSLETLLGVPVTIRRPGRDTTLSAAAEALAPHARALIAASEAALAAVTQQGQGVIRLGAVESISSFLLPEPLSAFRLLWPHIDVRIAIGLCEDLRRRLDRGELDAVLTIEAAGLQYRACEVRELSPTALQFVVSPRHPLATALVTRRDLETRTFLLTDSEGAFNTLLKAWLGSAARLESAGSIDGVKRGVLSGEAIGVLPDYSLVNELSKHSLVALNIEEQTPPISLRLMTLKSPPPGSPLDALIARILAARTS